MEAGKPTQLKAIGSRFQLHSPRMLARFVYRQSGPHLVHLHRITSEFLTRQVGASRVLLCLTQSLYVPLFSRATPVLVTPGNFPKNLHQQIPNEVNINILYREDSRLITRPYSVYTHLFNELLCQAHVDTGCIWLARLAKMTARYQPNESCQKSYRLLHLLSAICSHMTTITKHSIPFD